MLAGTAASTSASRRLVADDREHVRRLGAARADVPVGEVLGRGRVLDAGRRDDVAGGVEVEDGAVEDG